MPLMRRPLTQNQHLESRQQPERPFLRGVASGAPKPLSSSSRASSMSKADTPAEQRTPPITHRVSMGDTGHAEAIRITYDPTQISYDRLLDVFFDAHDPTQLNRQGNDAGTQYRSTIFYTNEIEQRAAQAKIKQLTAAKAFSRPIVTTLEPLKEFYPAEEYHQRLRAAASRSALYPVPRHPQGLRGS